MALVYAFPALAQGDANCTNYKKFTTQPEIIFTDTPLQIITDFTPAQLQEKRESYFYGWRKSGENSFWIADDTDVGGYFMSGIGIAGDYALQEVPHPNNAGQKCVYIERLWMNIFFSATVFWDQAYAVGACAGNRSEADGFMAQRYEAAHNAVVEQRAALEAGLSDFIKGLEDAPVLDKETRAAQVQEALSRFAGRYEEAVQQEIDVGNAEISKESAFVARYAACGKGAVKPPAAEAESGAE